MRGTILAFDRQAGTGLLLDAEGRRRTFARKSWRSPGEPQPDSAVDFVESAEGADDIYLLAGERPSSPRNNALIFGLLSLVLAAISMFIGNIGVVTLLLALLFGFVGMRAGRDLPDRTAYRLSVAGIGVAILCLVILLALIGLVSRSLAPPPRQEAISVKVHPVGEPVAMPPSPHDVAQAIDSYGNPDNLDASDPLSRSAQESGDMAALAEGLQGNPDEDAFAAVYRNTVPAGAAGRMLQLTHRLRVQRIDPADLAAPAPGSYLDRAIRLYGADAVRPECRLVFIERSGSIALADGRSVTSPRPRQDFGVACPSGGRFAYLDLR